MSSYVFHFSSHVHICIDSLSSYGNKSSQQFYFIFLCYKKYYKSYYILQELLQIILYVTKITTNCIIMLHTSLQSVLYATIVNTQFTTRCIQLNYIITWFIFKIKL